MMRLPFLKQKTFCILFFRAFHELLTCTSPTTSSSHIFAVLYVFVFLLFLSGEKRLFGGTSGWIIRLLDNNFCYE